MATQHDDITAAGVAGTWHAAHHWLKTGTLSLDQVGSSIIVGVTVWVITQILKGIWQLIRKSAFKHNDHE